MVTHVVLIKPKTTATLDEIQVVIDQIKALQTIIPGIVDAQVGKNASQQKNAYEYGLVMHFDTMDHLNAYLPHPAHQAAARELVRLSDDMIVFDLPA